MDEVQTSITPFPSQGAAVWIDAYQEEMLTAKDEATIEAYTRILEKFAEWLSLRPGNSGQFRLQRSHAQPSRAFSRRCPVLVIKSRHAPPCLASVAGCKRTSSSWSESMVRGVSIPAQTLLAPRELLEDQRYVIRDLVEREADVRGKAAFALGYWAGCRVSDVSWLLLDQVHVSRKAGWMTVGHKGGKERTIDLVNEARSPLYDYFQQGERKVSALRLYQKAARKSTRARKESMDGDGRRMASTNGGSTSKRGRVLQKPGSSTTSISMISA